MTTSKLVCILILVTASGLVSVNGKRQKPRHDEIERVTNDTHSDIWKCSNAECPPGSGLTVQCGTSISIHVPIKCVSCVKGVNHSNTHDHSTCKSCRNCTKNENKTGKCTPEEDTTECLGTCYKGFYMDNNTGNCHRCSDCCNNEKIYHEEQCEDSALQPNQQCRKSNITCLHSTKSTFSQLPNTGNPDNEQGSQEALTIALIIIAIFFIILFIVFPVLLRCYGWQKVKSFLRKWCYCCCRHGVPAEGIHSVNVHVSDQFFKGDSKAAVGSVYSGSHLTDGSDVLANPSSLSACVETEPGPMIDNLLAERVEVNRFSMGDDDFMGHNETPAPTELLEIDNFPVEDHDKNCDIKPASSEAVLGNGLQSAVSMVKAPGKEACLETEIPVVDYLPSMNVAKDSLPVQPASIGHGELPQICLQSVDVEVQNEITGQRPPVQDQGTSTTELHLLPAETLQFACIPQAFQTRLLSKTMSAIPIKFYRRICMMLDTLRRLSWNDFRLLAEKVGLDKDNISWLEQRENPTKLILQEFESQKDPSIGRFKAILEEMERNDVVTVIEDWVLDEWRKKNNNLSPPYSRKGPNNKLYSLV